MILMLTKDKHSVDFYKNLPVINDFKEIYNLNLYKKVPEDWYLFLCDIENSTDAIKKGKYKEVNMSTVFCIVAITNLLNTLEFPFIFGGDGVTFLIHKDYFEKAKKQLSSVKNLIKNLFNLNMRIGFISVSELYQKGYDLKIAKYKVSDCYKQALILGSALFYFEKEIKNNHYLLEEDSNVNVDLSGFSCRWEDIPTTKEEQLALIIETVEPEDYITLKEILNKIYEIYGNDENWHPVSINKMNLVPSTSNTIDIEAQVTGNPKFSWFRKILILIELKLVAFFSKLPFKIGIKINNQDITQIKVMNYVSSDFRKLENSLKLIINTSKEEKQKLLEYLEKLRKDKKIYYGYYSDYKAHITCAVFPKKNQDVHFIDVVNGGFTLASLMLKEQKSK
ncbi:MAG: hypothetical protein KatS3mg129_1776 [Leptospiraceae bacterium]|nr:MAG: hypothetical protein KatS3mg129_1776 [Leptospiraceae bacterium]